MVGRGLLALFLAALFVVRHWMINPWRRTSTKQHPATHSSRLRQEEYQHRSRENLGLFQHSNNNKHHQDWRTLFPTRYIAIPDHLVGPTANLTLTILTHRARAVYWLEQKEEESGGDHVAAHNTAKGSHYKYNDPYANAITMASSSLLPKNPFFFTVQVPLRRTTSTKTSLSPPQPPTFGLERVSWQANRSGCRYAVNAGPFHSDGSPTGSLVTNATVRTDIHNPNWVGFGVSRGAGGIGANVNDSIHNPHWVVGSVSGFSELSQLQDFVTGFGWLVYDGRRAVGPHDDTAWTGRAPRTAVGITYDGRLLLAVADGCEKWCVRAFVRSFPTALLYDIPARPLSGSKLTLGRWLSLLFCQSLASRTDSGRIIGFVGGTRSRIRGKFGWRWIECSGRGLRHGPESSHLFGH